MKLFKVNLRGSYTEPEGSWMVVAMDPSTAYNKVREALDKSDYRFEEDRELASIELLADDAEYPHTPHKLLICD